MEFLEYNHVTAEIKGTMVRFHIIYYFHRCYLLLRLFWRYFVLYVGSWEIKNDGPEHSIQEQQDWEGGADNS